MTRPFSICVYCGSRDGDVPEFAAAAEALGQVIGKNAWRLVYGAGDVGLMGRVARAAQASGADVFGVIPDHLVRQEVGKTDLSTFVVTETMHERKKVMLLNSDAVVLLPGGAGSLDEFFEALTWRQLGLHAKPIVILNINGYWDPLIVLLRTLVERDFAGPDILEACRIVNTVDEAERALVT